MAQQTVRISKDVVEKLAFRINEHADLHDLTEFYINAHGGEPFLLQASGLEMFYSTLTNNVNPRIKLHFGLQTNATLATKEIISVLNHYKVSVGVSMDGYDKANEFRVNHKGEELVQFNSQRSNSFLKMLNILVVFYVL